MTPPSLRTAVLVPCHNEEASIATVVADFRTSLPEATVYVYDNASTDATADQARAAGAIVRVEPLAGKGRVVRRMFADIEADVYVVVDGDATYDAAAAGPMVKRLLADQLDMVVGRRIADDSGDGERDRDAYRRGHTLGNRFFSRVLRVLFGSQFKDVFSGYRVMSRRFVKSLPVTSHGFEIETEITTHAVEVGAACVEIDTTYRARHVDSESSLRTYRDGFRILRKSIVLFQELRPLRFYTILSAMFTVVALALGIRVLIEFIETSKVPHFPTAILAASIQITAFVLLATGIILNAVGRGRRDARRLAYLTIPHPTAGAEAAH